MLLSQALPHRGNGKIGVMGGRGVAELVEGDRHRHGTVGQMVWVVALAVVRG